MKVCIIINPLLLKVWIALLFLYNNIIIVDVTITPMLKVIKNILLSDNVFFYIFQKKFTSFKYNYNLNIMKKSFYIIYIKKKRNYT